MFFWFCCSFVSSLLTGVLMYHLAWVPTVTPSGEAHSTYADKHSPKWVRTPQLFLLTITLTQSYAYISRKRVIQGIRMHCIYVYVPMN